MFILRKCFVTKFALNNHLDLCAQEDIPIDIVQYNCTIGFY